MLWLIYQFYSPFYYYYYVVITHTHTHTQLHTQSTSYYDFMMGGVSDICWFYLVTRYYRYVCGFEYIFIDIYHSQRSNDSMLWDIINPYERIKNGICFISFYLDMKIFYVVFSKCRYERWTDQILIIIKCPGAIAITSPPSNLYPSVPLFLFDPTSQQQQQRKIGKTVWKTFSEKLHYDIISMVVQFVCVCVCVDLYIYLYYVGNLVIMMMMNQTTVTTSNNNHKGSGSSISSSKNKGYSWVYVCVCVLCWIIH